MNSIDSQPGIYVEKLKPLEDLFVLDTVNYRVKQQHFRSAIEELLKKQTSKLIETSKTSLELEQETKNINQITVPLHITFRILYKTGKKYVTVVNENGTLTARLQSEIAPQDKLFSTQLFFRCVDTGLWLSCYENRAVLVNENGNIGFGEKITNFTPYDSKKHKIDNLQFVSSLGKTIDRFEMRKNSTYLTLSPDQSLVFGAKVDSIYDHSKSKFQQFLKVDW